MRLKRSFFGILCLAISVISVSQTLRAETLLCGQNGKGKFRLDSANKSLQFVQERSLLPDFTAWVRTYDSFKILNCAHCFSVSGEFYAGANVVVDLVTRTGSAGIVADITTGTTEGGADMTDRNVPCLLESIR